MTRKKIAAIVLFATALPLLWAESARDIMQKVIDNQTVASSAMDIGMDLVDSRGEVSHRRIQTLIRKSDGLTSTITIFLEPASVRNTRFLTIENRNRADDQWIYLPSLRKVKRIAATERSGSFMGSDFSYSDMSFTGISVDDSQHTLLGTEDFHGRSCYLIESTPLPGIDDSYGKKRSWVDKTTWLTLRVEFYAKDNSTLVKILESDDIKQIQNRWTAGKITMTTVHSGHKTTLQFKQVKYDLPLNSGFFTSNFLEAGRAK